MIAAPHHSRVASRFALVATAGIAALYAGTLALCRGGLVADGYDGIGFVQAVEQFDLARYAPQPPGYPLFVLLARLVHLAGPQPALALALICALLSAVGLGALAGVLRIAAGRFCTLLFLLLVPTAPIVYGLSMATLSDAAGLGCALLCVALSLRAIHLVPSYVSHALVGVTAGIALGIRPPLLPLLLLSLGFFYGRALLRGELPWRAVAVVLATGLATVLAWLVPFAYSIGPTVLWKLSLQHAHGHFADFGGTVFVEHAPLARLRDFFGGLLSGSLGRFGWLLLVPALVGIALGDKQTSVVRRVLLPTLALFVAYSAWALLALPTSGHGRHLLPLSILLCTIVALGLRFFSRHVALRFLLVAFVALLVVDNGRVVCVFRSTPPPGAQLSAYAARNLPEDRLYGARAARYLDLICGRGTARPAIYLGEVLANLERESNLPAEVLITSEVLAAASSQPRIKPLARFCYADAIPRVLRFDRSPHAPAFASAASGCVDLLAYRVRP